jgi:hypothetical protein
MLSYVQALPVLTSALCALTKYHTCLSLYRHQHVCLCTAATRTKPNSPLPRFVFPPPLTPTLSLACGSSTINFLCYMNNYETPRLSFHLLLGYPSGFFHSGSSSATLHVRMDSIQAICRLHPKPQHILKYKDNSETVVLLARY